MFVTNLDFDDIHSDLIHGLDILLNCVDRPLESRQMSQVELFRLNFSKIRAPVSKVSSWIDWAVRLNVREFDIHVIRLELPLSLLTCKTLTKLSIGLRLATTVIGFTNRLPHLQKDKKPFAI
ncbi:hypothetical protein Hanom_Chr16g01422561 [Helianthus anomalus]